MKSHAERSNVPERDVPWFHREGVQKLCTWVLHRLHSVCLFIWLVLICILYKKTVFKVKCFSELWVPSEFLTLKKVMCYRLDVCVAPKFLCWNLPLNVMVLEVIRSWGWSPHEWDYCSYKRPHRVLSHFLPWQQEDSCLWTSKQFLADTESPSPWILDFQPSTLWKNKYLLFKLPSWWCFCYSSPD